MHSKEYIVALSGTHWCVTCGDSLLVAFSDKQLAIDTAIEMASGEASGTVDTVVLLDENGTKVPIYDSRRIDVPKFMRHH
jgi:hypothetical protein